MLAASEGKTEVVSLLVKAGAALDLQNKVTLIPSLSNAVCDSDLTCVTIADQIYICRSRCGLGVSSDMEQ